MRLASIRRKGKLGEREESAIVTSRGPVPIRFINLQLGREWPTDLLQLIEQGLPPRLGDDANRTQGALAPSDFQYAPLYRRPRKIWGIGLNYREHAQDLKAQYPTEPTSFIKGDHTIIGPGDYVDLPEMSRRVTAEAELGVVIGRTCRNVPMDQALAVVAGYCLILDMTAEDLVLENPRFVTKAKNFDTFLALGPELITRDEVPDVMSLRVGTYKNNSLHRENVVSNMAFPPEYLISYHSRIATLYPGDIFLTGTPGAVVIEDGDVAECRIGGLGVLKNPVRQPWKQARKDGVTPSSLLFA
jgi:2-keto-4-pentenoate hydratase/2-oxohepta-3-ene-1,7-dioic acid hydratase in catechol pathway